MPDIKTREVVKDIKVLDKASVAGERMRNAYALHRLTVLLGRLYDINKSKFVEKRICYGYNFGLSEAHM